MADIELIRRTFVELADTLVDSFDLIDFLHVLTDRSVELLGVAEAGIVLADAKDDLHVLASSSERMLAVELLEVQRSSGPCGDAFRTGDVIREHDLASAPGRWAEFGDAALAQGFRSVYAVPMRLRDDRIGALNLFADRPHGLSAEDEAIGQAMADVATIGILQERSVRRHQELAEQLSGALESRIVLEQAKGVLAEQGNVEVDAAFDRIRRYARDSNVKLASVARQVVARQLSYEDLVPRSRDQRG